MACIKKISVWVAFAITLVATTAEPAWATDQLDLSVALKTLPLLTDKIAGSVKMSIVYDPASLDSKHDAEMIKATIDGGFEAHGNIKLTADLVSTLELQNVANGKLAILAHGTPQADYNSINAATSSAGVLTVSTDLECVKANKCVLGVVSRPRVEIYYSSGAAESAHISFSPAFTMLVKQI